MKVTADDCSLITVCVPTYKRAHLLPRLLKALEDQDLPPGISFEILFVDNDPDRSAEATVLEYSRKSRVPVRYLSEPVQGIARVRNRLIDEAHGHWLAFIDDDEWPTAHWLQSLFKTWGSGKADIVFGPVLPFYPENIPRWVRVSRVFERPIFAEGAALSVGQIGGGNFFCERGLFIKFGVRFSETFNSGGEDAELFDRVAKAGAKFIGSNNAVAYEHVPEERVHVSWWLRRAFYGGHRHARIYHLQNRSPRYFVWAGAKAAFLSALIFPSMLLGRLGLVKVGIPFMANLGKLATLLRSKPSRRRRAEKPIILVIGPTPPPHHGVAMATRMLLDLKMQGLFHLSHLELADRRGIAHVDQPDLYDVFLFIRQWFTLLWKFLRDRPHIAYLPISQTTLGVIRDSLFIWPSFLFGARIVLHLHGGNFRRWYEERDGLTRAYVRLLLKTTARVVVLGASLKPLFSGLVPESRISVVPNGIEWGKPRGRGGRSAGGRRFRILYLGTLTRLKGVLVLVAAIPLTLKRRPDVEFVFAGGWFDPKDRREAEAAITQAGVEGHVIWTGPVKGEEKEALFASADLFVFPGVQQEGQPLVVIEAMAAGLPILFTDRGCLRETVIAEENGREVRINDPEDLAEQIVRMLENPEGMREMGRRSRARYEANYTEKIFLQRMVVLFSLVMRKGDRC